MKYVYVAIDTTTDTVIAVARKRRRLRKAIDRDWLEQGRGSTPLIWGKDAWSPLMRAKHGMGLASHPGLQWAPYDIEKHGVL